VWSARGRVVRAFATGALLVGCKHASNPSAPGCCDKGETARGLEAGAESRAFDAGATGFVSVGSRFRKEEGCARDFKTSGTAMEDVARLEHLCAQGMVAILPEPASLRSTAGVVDVPFRLASPACVRAAAVSSAGPLSISLLDSRGATLATASAFEPLAVVPTDGTVCVRDPGSYRALVRLAPATEPANVALQIWQAVRDY
jgi:hypothetical protein